MVYSDPSQPDPSRLDAIFHALGDGTRRRMLAALTAGEKTVGELAAPFDISLAAASKHVRVLEEAGLLTREIRWRSHHCRLSPPALAAAHGWLEDYARFWTGGLDRLEALLKAEETAPTTEEDRDDD